MELTKRELSILREVVRLYIDGGEPVSSRQIARSSGLGLSAASIRNVLSDLEEKGMVARAHTSAGCVPTDPSFRMYVDSALQRSPLPAAVKRRLESKITQSRRDLVEDMEWVARVVAEVTREAGVAVRPMGEEQVLEAVFLVPLATARALGIVVTAAGALERRVVELGEEMSADDLQTLATFLSREGRGEPLQRLRTDLAARAAALGSAEGDEPTLLRRAARVSEQLFQLTAEDVEVLVAGAEFLLQTPEFAEVERMRSLMAALQDRTRIVDVLQRFLEKERTQVIIGHESEVTASGNLGMVATLFYHGGRRVGAVGVVGPRRMDYVRIVPVVEFIGDTLTQILDEAGESHA